jgi:hypothetical protein
VIKRRFIFAVFFLTVVSLVTPQNQAYARALRFAGCMTCFTKASTSDAKSPKNPPAGSDQDQAQSQSPQSEEEESHGSHSENELSGNAVLAIGPALAYWPGRECSLPSSDTLRLSQVSLSEPTPPPEA